MVASQAMQGTDISQRFQRIVNGYVEARKTPFGKVSPLWNEFKILSKRLQDSVRQEFPHVQVVGSAGKGNWAEVPWVSILDERVTTRTTDGVYCVYLFRADMSGVYLTFNQGVTETIKRHGRQAGLTILQDRAQKIAERFPALRQQGFVCDEPIVLRGGQLGSDYEVGTIAHKFYPAETIPEDKSLLKDLRHLLSVYNEYADGVEESSSSNSESDELMDELMAVEPNTSKVIELAAIVHSFAEAIQEAGISFGVHHTAFVRTFLVSLLTKRFVILTGMSGSGKTQIAMKFGEWLGADRFQICAVRPDWTGAEALFGYEDALAASSADGRRGWAVPAALEFMLKAHNYPDAPFLLILDEMNLAHVERYFADVLSGMESGAAVLPNLGREADGVWRIKAGEFTHVPVPKNLFVVGTVNIDETTYIFSPKVLDRANTIEFRVPTDSLRLMAAKPMACAPASVEFTRGLLSVARAPAWSGEPPVELEAFAAYFRVLHELLAEAGFEFGHRVFFEANRYAALHRMVDSSENFWEEALDRQVMQKVLPRLHGSRRRLEPVLCALGQFCYDLTYHKGAIYEGTAMSFDPVKRQDNKAVLPLSLDKIGRMTRNLRANQFTSFTE